MSIRQLPPQRLGRLEQGPVGPDVARPHGAAVDHADDLGPRVTAGVLEGPQGVDASRVEGVRAAVRHGGGDPLSVDRLHVVVNRAALAARLPAGHAGLARGDGEAVEKQGMPLRAVDSGRG